MNKGKIPFSKMAVHGVLISGVCLTAIPLIYMITTALRPNAKLYEYPPRLFPDSVTLANFRYILFEQNFGGNFINSIVVALGTVVLAAFVASTLAFVIARFEFPGRNLLCSLIMGTMIIPGMVLILPQFELITWLGLLNSRIGLILVYVSWVVPFSTFLMKGFIEDIPHEFDEAVYIDGGSVGTLFRWIVLPLSGPAIITTCIFNFLTAWEEYPWALTVINDTEKRTLPIAIAGFFGEHNFTQWGYVFAMSLLSLIPVVVIFIFLQRFFISGLSSGAIKG